MTGQVGTLALACSLAMSACSGGAPRTEDEAQVRASIRRVLEQHGQAAMRSDAAAGALAFAPDTRVFFAGTPEVRGRDSLMAFMARAWAAMGTPRDVQFTTDELHVFGNAAVEIGMVSYSVGREGQPPVHGRDRYMLLWTRDSTGAWTILRDLSQSAPPLGATQ